MSKTYNEPGKARKLCVCGVYVHARALNCPSCNHVFGVSKMVPKPVKEPREKAQVEKKEPAIYSEPGKGRKLCGNCNIYVAARLRECPKCSQTIEKVAKAVAAVRSRIETKTETVEEQKKYVGILIHAPRGKPPFEPTEDIENWCTQVFEEGLKENITYSNQALWYWYQQFNNDDQCKQRIWNWSKQAGFDKMQGYSAVAVLSAEESETDTFQLPD